MKHVLKGILLLLVAAGMQPALAQDGGEIRGTVYDAVTNEPLVGANVFIKGTSLGAAADLEGAFVIRNVPSGTYQVQASVIGYTPLIDTDVIAAPGRQTVIEFPLQPTAIDLEEVVVEADYFRRDADAPVSSQSLSYEEIRRSPGGQEDVIRAIAVLPGVVQTSAGRNDLIVRGGAPSENLYVVDGLEIPNINHFGTQGATGGPLSFINLDFVQDVTFATGGFGARYGDKLSSVMNIALRDGRTDRLGGKLNISATQFGANAEGPLGDGGSFFFSARRSYLDLIFKAAGFGFVPEYWDFTGKASMKLDKSNELNFVGIGALDAVRFFNDTEDQRYGNSRILGNSQDQYFTSLSWKHLMNKGVLTVGLGRTYVQYDYLQTDSLLQPLFENANKEGETSLRADIVLLPSRDLELSGGAQGKLVKLDGNVLWQETTNGQFPGPPGGALANAWDTTGQKFNAYAQVAKTFFSRLRATVGVRMDYFSMIDQPVEVGPRAALSYTVSPVTTLNLSGGVYYQAPSYIWLMSNAANTRLQHIRVNQGVLGVEHLLRSDLKVRVEGYLKEYRDYPASLERPWLVLANTGAGFGGAEEGFTSFGFDNLVSEGTGISRGLEFLVQKRLSDLPYYGIASLTFSWTDYTAIDGVQRSGLYDQRIISNLSGGYKFGGGWEASFKFRYGSGMPYTPFEADGSRDYPNTYNSARLPVFHSLDLRVDKRWDFPYWNLITYIDVQNVYNRNNVQGYRWDFRNMSVEEAGGTIGILPTIGISAEF